MYPERIVISDGAAKIGAVNMILIDQNDVFHLVNSDGQGMGNAVENFLGGSLAGRRVFILGAGGAARAVLYEISRRVSAGPGGSVVLFNRTFEKGRELVEEFSAYFPNLRLSAERMENLKAFYDHEASRSDQQDILISSITSGDPLFDYRIYEALKPDALIVDANYGGKCVLSRNAAHAGRRDLHIHDGRGMVIEGYVIPSKMEAAFWKQEIRCEVYQTIAALFDYRLFAEGTR
jgi:shikimate dehydrogenase